MLTHAQQRLIDYLAEHEGMDSDTGIIESFDQTAAADALGIAKTTLKYHLSHLRSLGCIETVQRGPRPSTVRLVRVDPDQQGHDYLFRNIGPGQPALTAEEIF